MQDREGHWYTGTRIVAANAVAMTILYATQLAAHGLGEEGVRAVVRASAQTSLLCLVITFSASSLRQLFPNERTRWLLVNRRYFGVSMGFSHTVHFFTLVALAKVAPEFSSQVSTVTLIFGGTGFVLCWLMTLTSTNAMVARLGAARWRALHKFGSYYLWFIFAQSYLPRMFMTSPAYVIPVMLLFSSLGLRRWAWSAKKGMGA